MPPLVLVLVDALVLAGNVFFPVLLRWAVLGLHQAAPDGSSHKVCCRHLLTHGRRYYTHLFTSQHTWLLFTLQLGCTAAQAVFLCALGTGVNRNQAVFMSINARHAGFSSVDLRTQNAGILVLFFGDGEPRAGAVRGGAAAQRA